jgi:glycosyltransferase involved in cell wall biosynthesis
VVAVADPSYAPGLRPEVTLERFAFGRGRYRPDTLLRLYRVLRRHRPDVIHAQANMAAVMVGLVGRFLPAARVATIHNQKRSTGMFRRFDRVIAVSKGVAACVAGMDPVVVYNGIEPRPAGAAGKDGPTRLPRARDGRPVVLAVGRLVTAKGFDLLINAWGGLDADLMIVGEGPERPALEARVAALGLADRIRLPGHRDDVPTLMQGADLLVIASRREGFSYVLLEALQAGLPVVATRVPVADEILPEPYLVATGDVGALHRCLAVTLADLDGAKAAFAPVWRFARTELTLERMVARTEAVYRDAVAGRSGGVAAPDAAR